MRHKKQAGFGIIEIILLILFILFLLFLIWYLLLGGKNSSNNSPSNTPAQQNSSASEQAQNDPMADWIEYCSPVESSCFKYPKDWTLQDDPNNAGSSDEFKQLVSPNGTTLNWASYVSGVGGSCDPATEPIVYITSVDADNAVSNLYVVGTGLGANASTTSLGLVNGTNNQPPSVGSTGDCLYIELFDSKDGTRQMWFSSGTLIPSDIDTAKLILGSYHY